MALDRLLQSQPSDEVVRVVTDVLTSDRGGFPVFRSTARLGELKREQLRSFFRAELHHPNYGRRAHAVVALGKLAPTPVDMTDLRGLVNDRQPYSVVRAAMMDLQLWDAAANRNIFERAKGLASPHNAISALAYDILHRLESSDPADPDPKTTAILKAFLADIAHGTRDSPRMLPGLSDEVVPRRTATVAGWLQNLKSFSPLAAQESGARRHGV